LPSRLAVGPFNICKKRKDERGAAKHFFWAWVKMQLGGSQTEELIDFRENGAKIFEIDLAS
jgi:hypothetical protein